MSKRPENIEQLTEMEEYINTVNNVLGPLSNGIEEMLKYYSLLDEFCFKTDFEEGIYLYMYIIVCIKLQSRVIAAYDSP